MMGGDIETPPQVSVKNKVVSSTDNLSTINNNQKNNHANGPLGTNANIAPIKQKQTEVESPSITKLSFNGGASSAWRSTVYSRGPVNYPNNGWYDGKQQFDQFSKSGEYIKNTDLPYAAAPISTGAMKDPDCMKGTISKWGDQFAKFGGAKNKKSVPKKKKSVTKKKKSVPKKKKSVPKKKKSKK